MEMMPDPHWPDPPGWDPTPCCGSHALLPLAWLAARTWLATERCWWWQKDHSPVWPSKE
jgi:hypothetical protein